MHIGLDIHSCIGLALEIFIFYALAIDLYKWCVFIAATSKTGEHNYEEILGRRKKYLAAGFEAISVIIFITYWIVVYGVMSTSDEVDIEENKEWKFAIKNMVTTIFIMFLVAHITTLTLLITRLKARVPEFYKLQRK